VESLVFSLRVPRGDAAVSLRGHTLSPPLLFALSSFPPTLKAREVVLKI